MATRTTFAASNNADAQPSRSLLQPLVPGAELLGFCPRIVFAGNPVLRSGTRRVLPSELSSPEFGRLIEWMRAALRNAPGVGLAAPQIGLPLRLCIVEDRAEYQARLSRAELRDRKRRPVPFHVLVNPKLRRIPGQNVIFREGCLSVPGYSGLVPRAPSVEVVALDHRGLFRTVRASGWYARILQHEIDHLDGRLYIDRMDSRSFEAARP